MKRTYHTNLAIAYNLGILPDVLFFFIAKRKVPKEKLVAGYGFRENKRSAPTGYNSSLRSSNRHPDNSSPLRCEKIVSAARIFSDPKTIYGDIVR